MVLAACASSPAKPTKPGSFACRYKAAAWYAPEMSLAPGRGAPPIALARRTWKSEIVLAWGDPKRLRAVLQGNGVELRGEATLGSALQVTSRVPLSLGVVQWEPGARLTWRRVEPGAFEQDVENLSWFTPRSLPRVALQCEETQLLPRFPLAATKDAGVEAPRSEWALAGGKPIPLAATPGGESEGEFHIPADASWRATIVEERADSVRVRQRVGFARIDGWVARSALVPLSVRNSGLGLLGARVGDEERPVRARCASSTPLFVRAGDAVFEVGTLHAGAAVATATHAAGFIDVTLPELSEAALPSGAAWAIREADEARCFAGAVPPAL